MKIEENIDFKRIEQAINYIRTHFKQQPSLDEIAAAVNLSPHHFQLIIFVFYEYQK